MQKQLWFFSALLVVLCTSTPALATIDGFKEISPGVWRGSQPTTDADYRLLRSRGIRTVINLRSDGSFEREKENAERHGLYNLHYGMNGFVYPSKAAIGQIVAIMKDRRYQPVFIHCKMGHDRTGLVAALYRIHAMGWSKPAAREEMVRLGYHSYFFGLESFWNNHSSPGSLEVPRLP